MNDFPSWCQVVTSCNTSDLLKALGEGLPFIENVALTGLLPDPFADQTPDFCYNVLKTIIEKMFSVAYSYKDFMKDEIFINFYNLIFQIALASLNSENSYFTLLFYLFGYSDEYEQNNGEFISFLTNTLFYRTDQFQGLIKVFSQYFPLPLEDYMTFYFLACKFQNTSSDFKENVLSSTVPIFFNSLSMQNASSLRSVPLNVLLTLFNHFFHLYLDMKLEGDELLPLYNFLRECIQCTVLEKQLFGAHYYKNIFFNVNENCQNVLIQWFVSNNFFPNLVTTHPHVEVLSALIELFDKMSQNQLISNETIFDLWEQSRTAQVSERDTYFRLISHCLQSLNETSLTEFLHLVDDGLDLEVLAHFYKACVIEISSVNDNILEKLLDLASTKLDYPIFKKIFIELILTHDETIIKKINKLANSWIENKIYHPSAYEIINSLFNEEKPKLVFYVKVFLEYIVNGVKEVKSDSKQLYNLLLAFLNYFKILLPRNINIQLYEAPDKQQFWLFMSKLLDSRDLESTPEHEELIKIFIDKEDILNTTKEYIEFMINYYLKYSILEDKSIKKASNKEKNYLYKPNVYLDYLFTICGTVKNSNCATILTNFLLALFLNSKMTFSDKIDYFVNQCVRIMNKNLEENSSQLPQLLQLLISFIDSEEGKIDFSIFGATRMKNSSKLYPISVPTPSKKLIELKITPQTSVFAIKNVLSALFSIPVEIISIESSSIPKMRTEDNQIIIKYKKRSKTRNVIECSQFPVFLLSTKENTEFLIDLLQGDLKTSKIAFKLLNRFIFVQLDCDSSLEFYLRIFSNTSNDHPFFFRYMTQRFYMLLETKTLTIEPEVLQRFLNELIRVVLTRQYESSFLVPSIEILADYYDEKRSSEEICNLLEIATTDHKYIYQYLRLIAKLLPEKTGVVINSNILIKLIKMITTDEIYGIFCLIIDCAMGESSLYSLIVSIITNPVQFIICEDYIEPIVQQILTKMTDNVGRITDQVVKSFNIKQENAIPILCKVLKALFNPEFNNTYDLSEFVINLLTNCAFSTTNDKLQKSIFDLSAIFNDDLQDSFIMSCSTIQAYNFNRKLYTRRFKTMSGLINLGCTCYMNSILQQLSANNGVLASLAQTKTELRPDVKNLFELFSKQRFGLRNYYSTSNYCEEYSKYNREFNTHEQEDAVEYFNMILDGFPAETKQLFEGKFKEIFSRGEADVKSQILSEREEIFTTVGVSVSGFSDLSSSVRQLLAPEKLTKDNRYTTESGEKVDAYKYTRFFKLPRFLVFHLKRFEYNLLNFTRYKINSRFEFPTTLNMGEFSDEDSLYRLKGAVIHMGVAEGGHYVSVVRQQRKWILCDDSSLSEMTEENFLDSAFGGESGDRNAYLLFFERDDEKGTSEISDSSLFSMLPEQLGKDIVEDNKAAQKNCSLLTKSCYNYFLNRNPDQISVYYFFNSLCHSIDYDRIIQFAAHIQDCKFYILNSVGDLLELLSNVSDGNKATNSIIDVVGKSTDFECIGAFLSESEKIVANNDLLKKVAKIFKVAVSKNSIPLDGFNLISSFINKNFADKEKIETFEISIYFEVLIYAKQFEEFSIEPLLPIISKIGKSESQLLSSMRFLLSRNTELSSIDQMYDKECQKLQLYEVISSLSMPQSFERTLACINNNEIKQLVSNDKDVTVENIINEMKNLVINRIDPIIKLLKEEHQIIIDLLLNEKLEVRTMTESLVVALFMSYHIGNDSNDSNLTYDSYVPYINSDSQNLVNDLTINIINLLAYEEASDESESRGDDPKKLRLLVYFRTLNWFSACEGISCNISPEIIESLSSLVSIISKKDCNPNYCLFQICKFVNSVAIDDSDSLIIDTFKAFFIKEITQDSSLKDLSYYVSLFFPIISNFDKRNSEAASDLLKSKQFMKICKRASSAKNITDYPPFVDLRKFVGLISENNKDYQKKFDGVFEDDDNDDDDE